MLPKKISVEAKNTNHIQGIAVDAERKYVYCSFTTELIKYDMNGNAVGSVRGLIGHLGCIAYNYENGKVYGSLEYKHDAIGAGIIKNIDGAQSFDDGFYVAVFDVEKIDRIGMSAESDGVMRAAYLEEVTRDYLYDNHRYGCSGIDGTTFAPKIGKRDGKNRLYIAYGIYGDTSRTDNDHQVILSFDPDEVERAALPLSQNDMHKSAASPLNKYFVYTGNTTYGVQNLEYDPYTNTMIMAVYRGKKPQFPNFATYMIDMSVAPKREPLCGKNEQGDVLTLSHVGERDAASGVWGSHFNVGSTGIAALGDGTYYFSHNREDYANKRFYSDICLYRRNEKTLFEPIL